MGMFGLATRSRPLTVSADFTTAEIDHAAAEYTIASAAVRASDRRKRAARKLLDRLADGRYGAWLIERVPGGRETPDLEAIGRQYAALGLGPVPMKPVAPSLKVTRVR